MLPNHLKMALLRFVLITMTAPCLAHAAPGDLDPTFNGSGIVTTPIATSASVNSIALQANGKIVAVGFGSNGSNWDFTLARYNTNGTLDTIFRWRRNRHHRLGV